MKVQRHWIIVLAMLTTTLAFGNACGDDDQDGAQATGTGGSSSSAQTGGSGGGGSSGTGNGGSSAGGGGSGTGVGGSGTGGGLGGTTSSTSTGSEPDGGPPSCELPPDLDPRPSVRFINALLPSSPGNEPRVGELPALQLYLNDALVSGLSAVPAGNSAASVTPYVKVTEGASTFSVHGAGAGEGPFALSADILSITDGARYTIIAVGQKDQSAPYGPQLLVLQENFSTPTCNEVVLRFIADDSVGGATSFQVDKTAPGAGESALAFGASPEEGVVVPLTSASITLTNSSPFGGGPTGQEPFSIPSGLLVGGRSYFVIEMGEWERGIDDEHNLGLLVVPAGDDTPATWVKRDPLVFFFHASPPPTPSGLELFSGTERLAINLSHGAAPTFTDLPSRGATLKVVQPGSGGSGGVVVDDQDTGPLEPGSIYLGGLLGMSGESAPKNLQLKLWRVQLPLMSDYSTRAMVINASATAPAVDFGYWAVNPVDGSRGTTFNPTFTSVAYASASPTAAFPVPEVLGREWVGVQPTGELASNRIAPLGIGSAAGWDFSAGWNAVVLVGDWAASDAATRSQLLVLRYSSVGIPNASVLALPPL